jgi:ribosomal 30S subunit maturation factor RimM
MALVKFAGVDTVESAVALRGRVLYIDRQDAPMETGDYLCRT